jgi:hypothetical protein
MNSRTISHHALLLSRALLCLPFLIAPLAGRAETDGNTAIDTTTIPAWGEWQSAPGFPGIKIRVICQAFHAETGESEWNFQFQNTYPKRVHLVYEQEAVDSTGNPPSFVINDGHDLKPKEQSPVFADNLKGSCEARKLIYIGVVSIDNQPKPTPASTSKPPSASNKKQLASAKSDPKGSPKLTNVSADVTPQKNTLPPPPPPIPELPPVPVTASEVVGLWRCNFHQNSLSHSFELDGDGFGYGFYGLTSWTVRNNILNWTDHSGQLVFEGQFRDAKTLDGTVVFSEDLNFLPNHQKVDTVHCTVHP